MPASMRNPLEARVLDLNVTHSAGPALLMLSISFQGGYICGNNYFS